MMWHRTFFTSFYRAHHASPLCNLQEIPCVCEIHRTLTHSADSSCRFPAHLPEPEHTHANTKRMTNIPESAQRFQYSLMNKHGHISSLCMRKTLPHSILPPGMQLSGNHSSDSQHLWVSSKLRYGVIIGPVVKSFWNFTLPMFSISYVSFSVSVNSPEMKHLSFWLLQSLC